MRKLFVIEIALAAFIILMYSAGCHGDKSYMRPADAKDSAATSAPVTMPSGQDTAFAQAADTAMHNNNAMHKIQPDNNVNTPAPQVIAKGYAIVYCPSKMITHVPSIIDAQISKNELTAAYANFMKKIQEQNPGKKEAAIAKDVKGDSIDIFEQMSVAIEFDADDFKQISKDNNLVQAFSGKSELEWDWVIKPLHSTQRSIINFKFYGTDPSTNQQTDILEKTINITVQVDARSYFEKWGDFLLDDPKTTLTVIIIPFLTFIGGFVTGKRKKA